MLGRSVQRIRTRNLGQARPKRKRGLSARFETLDRRELLAVVLPAGFAESSLVSGLKGATSMTVAPDGRIFVGESSGTVRVVKDGKLLDTPFAQFHVEPTVSQGFLSLELDPDFETNHFVYVYYVAQSGKHENNILSRVLASGDTMVPGSENVLFKSQPFQIPPGYPAHDAGHFTFGPDGKIYIPTGDMDVTGKGNSQKLDNVFGKVLRINPDGTIPTDNPFYQQTTGINRSIYALGLRNPFSIAEDPATGRIYIDDVGDQKVEEIDELVPGANYGWPAAEGPSTDPRFTNPIYSYTHTELDTSPKGTAIIGGVFYHPTVESFPARFTGRYFFTDYANGWIKTLDPATRQVESFAKGLPPGIVGVDLTPDGRIIYLSLGTNEIREIQYAPASAPLLPDLADKTAPLEGQATFQANASGTAPYTYQWQLNGTNWPGHNSAELVMPGSTEFNGAQVRVLVTNQYGTTASNPATFHVSKDRASLALISLPPNVSQIKQGQVLHFSGLASDGHHKPIPASRFSWSLDLLHNEHVHPGVYRMTGRKSGSVRLPVHAENGHIAFRLTLTVVDKADNSTSVSRVIDLGTPHSPEPGASGPKKKGHP